MDAIKDLETFLRDVNQGQKDVSVRQSLQVQVTSACLCPYMKGLEEERPLIGSARQGFIELSLFPIKATEPGRLSSVCS